MNDSMSETWEPNEWVDNSRPWDELDWGEKQELRESMKGLSEDQLELFRWVKLKTGGWWGYVPGTAR